MHCVIYKRANILTSNHISREGETFFAFITFNLKGEVGRRVIYWAAFFFLSRREGRNEKPGTRSFLALQKHLEAHSLASSSIALCGWSSTQKTRKNSIYNIHIYKYIMFTHSLRHIQSGKKQKSTVTEFIELLLVIPVNS